MTGMMNIQPTLETELLFWDKGHTYIAGLDEAGRGAWAGPVYAAAVVLPLVDEVPDALREIRDSKTLSARQREAAFEQISASALALGIGWATAEEIDARGIVPATRLAMRRALKALDVTADALIIDALALPTVPLPQRYFPRADALSLSVAAAGIVAKVSRDRWMAADAECDFPGYGFAQHKGYGTAKHRTALNDLGPCPIHRQTFRPIAKRLAAKQMLKGSDS
jgi:ribonuclease HII